MKRRILLDTGVLVASLNRQDRCHFWAIQQLRALQPPLLTCEAVISETCFLLHHAEMHVHAVFEWLQNGAIVVPFHLSNEIPQIETLMRKYADVPMSFADACLVRMAELYDDSAMLTLDADFRIYRKHGRQRIDTIMPEE